MGLSHLSFRRDWTNPADFPTVEPDEATVRADLQYHPDAIKNYINETLIPSHDSLTYAKHSHGNKTVLDGITADDVEKWRGAIGTFRVNVTSSNGVYSADRTFDEIKAAYNAGQQPYVVETGGVFDLVYTLAHFYASDEVEQEFADFERYLIFGDTLETETLRIYALTTESGSNIENRTSSFDVPSGVGIQSVKQTVTSTEDGGTNVITVTKTDGTSSAFTVRNGSKGSTGATGAAGKDGYTPVRGRDYWTADDITTIQNYVDSRINTELAGTNTLLGSGIQISFTIDGETLSAVSGETWAEWIGGYSRVVSETSGLTLYNSSHVFADEAGVYAVSLDGSTAVSSSDTIVSGATYTIINWGG